MATNKNNAPKATETTQETPKATETTQAPKDNRVEVFVPKGYANDEPNLFVSVNGVNYLLPKGKKSLVPPHVAAEIERSKKAAERQDEKMEQMLEASK